MASREPEFEVGIIGGGPAGSTLASYLARGGVKCVVLEREMFPRPHVGESLVPATTRVLDEIGFLPQMEEAKFVHKYGAVWTATHTRRTFGLKFGEDYDYFTDVRLDEVEQPGVHQDHTYHVDRSKFDLLLLKHAEQLGATVCQGIVVQRVDFHPAGHPEIVTSLGGKEIRFRVRIVADASGRRTLLGNQLKLKVKDPHFDQFAIHSWFEDFDRGTSPQHDYIFIHFLPMLDTWVWQIPITDRITSIGVVTQRKHFAGTKEDRKAFFWQCMSTRPELHEKLCKARQVRPFQEEGDYSYSMKRLSGDGFLLVGDAGRFVDPIFSSGVSIALNSARLASKAILGALASGDVSEKSFQAFEAAMRHGTSTWYKFITLFYRLNLLYTLFLRDPRHRPEVVRLLQGEVWDEVEPPVLAEMQRVVEAVERDPEHVWHHLLRHSSAQLQAQAL
ncbi:MAG TPA: NAD(P)/FAD-dependent oxidoreductase [Thermoanaerobaculia bacterium]|jgi:FADH2 O2-dependent halogenase